MQTRRDRSETLPLADDGDEDEQPSRWPMLAGLAGTAAAICVTLVYELIHLTGYSYPTGSSTSIYVVSAFDEGVYTETGALIAQGYKLYQQIYSAQPPLMPVFLAAVSSIAGTSLEHARVLILIASLVAVAATAATGYLSQGWLAGGLGAVFVALTPEYLLYSHAIEEEIPMTALAAVSMAWIIWWYRKPGWLPAGAAGFFLSVAVLTKFLAFSLLAPAVVVLALVAWDRREHWGPIVRDAVVFVLAAVIPFGLTLVIWGQGEWNQMVSDRLGASADGTAIQEGSSIHIFHIFLQTDPGLAIAAAIGAVALLVCDWKTGLILDSWLAATALILLRYHPLFSHHLAVLLVPMGLVAGAGVSTLASALPQWQSLQQRQLAICVLGILAGLAYVVLLPAQVNAYGQLLTPRNGTDIQLNSVAAAVDRIVPPGRVVAASDPMICVLADRPCVPQMVDTSYVRVLTGKLAQAKRYTEKARARAVVLSRALCQAPDMTSYVNWVRRTGTLIRAVAIDSKPYCPVVSTGLGPEPAPHAGKAGIYRLGSQP